MCTRLLPARLTWRQVRVRGRVRVRVRARARARARHPARRQGALGDDVVEREDAVGHEVVVTCACIHAYMTSLAATETLNR